MTNVQTAFEKWFSKEFGEAYYPTDGMKLAWESATAEANKRIVELERDNKIYAECNAELKEKVAYFETVRKQDKELVTKSIELQASNNALKDALYVAFAYCPDNQSFDYIETLLAATQAESLQAFENEVIERCADICDEMVDWSLEKHPSATIKSNDYLIGIRRGLVNATNAIRSLKEVK